MINLKLADVILRQRKMRNMTQEELAADLGVTAQAVSNWERGGYPDITMLPAIANYFEISIDELLGNDESAKEEDIRYFTRMIREELPNDDMETRVKLGKEYIAKYPKNFDVLHEMCFIIFCCEGKLREENIPLLKVLCEKIIEECTVQTYRESAVKYMCILGDDMDWEKWSRLCAEDYKAYRGEVLENRLLEKERFDECVIRKGVNKLEIFCHLMMSNCGNWHDPEKSIAWIDYRIELMKSFGENGIIPTAWQRFFAVMMTYKADQFFRLAKNDEGYEALEEAYRNLAEWTDIPDGTALDVGFDWMFHGVKVLKNKWTYVLPDGTEEYSNYMSVFTDHGDFLKTVMNMPYNWNGFIAVRGEERYQKILKKAEKLAEKQSTNQ